MSHDDFSLERERAFVERLKRKDAVAWKTVVVAYHVLLQKMIQRSLAKRGLSLEYADEIESKTWYTAFSKIASFVPREQESLRNWLSSIQTKHVSNLSRREITRTSNELPSLPDDGFEMPDMGASSPEMAFIDSETQREIWQAVELAMREELSARDREIILLRFMHKKSVDELAALYGLQRQTVYQIVSKSMQRLHNYLSANELFRGSQARKETRTWKK